MPASLCGENWHMIALIVLPDDIRAPWCCGVLGRISVSPNLTVPVYQENMALSGTKKEVGPR
jgi:hypothetical protein